MVNKINRQSIAIMPADRNDLVSIGGNLQKTIDSVNTLLGVNGVKEPIRLSKLEQPEEPEIANFEQASTRIEKLTAKTKQLEDAQKDLIVEVDQLEQALADEEELSVFASLPSYNFDAAAWNTFKGVAYESVLGSSLSNPPTGVTINNAETYQVFAEVFSQGAFTELIHLIGDSNNRVFKRSGSDLTNAIANGWKEL